MTKEEKQLLIKDLCARLPYGVKVKYLYWDEDKGCEYPTAMILDDINSDGYIRFHGDVKEGEGRGVATQYLPYLRPISSMTEEEKRVLNSFAFDMGNKWFDAASNEEKWLATIENSTKSTDYLYSKHLDIHGLIEMGLALEAPDGMYKTE